VNRTAGTVPQVLPERIRLVVLFGGRSAEHDVSRQSAASVLSAVDEDRYEVVPVGIEPDGTWVLAGSTPDSLPSGALTLPVKGAELDPLPAVASTPGVTTVVLPLLHGPMGEDGTVQGMLELAGVPYVGAGVLGSAACMDKAVAKELLARAGLPQVPWLALRETEVDDALPGRVAAELGWPVFVKPANLGSSVGVSRADGPESLTAAVEEALRFDEWVVIEEAVPGARELEVGVLGNATLEASLPGEIVPSHEFYDYEDKYLDGAARMVIPADVPADVVESCRTLAVQAARALRAEGMARVDFFYDGERLLVNEVNTIPGFTSFSMFPSLWAASGVPYGELIDRLVELALDRHRRRSGRVGRSRD
jgi:D-alanine-D-alanine ligase